VQLPDGQDRSAQINDARAVPLLSAALCLTRVGPPPATLFFLPPFPCCHVSSTHLLLGGPRGSPFSHHPLISCRVYHALSTSVHHPKASSFSCLLPIYLDVFRRGSPPVPPSAITLPPHHSFYALPNAITPTVHHVLRAGPHVRLSRYPVIPGGSARSHPNPEVLSWLGHYQSQEAVIEAVEGG
jgi:hypothetical protein